jgi:hypothetical protein
VDHSGHLAGSHNWWVPAAREMGGLSPGSTTVGGGGTPQRFMGNTQGVQFRSPLDARRAAKGQLSQAEWPDGYLGNIIDRRQDKILKAVRDRQSGPSYQRGVHKGSRIDPREYLWPDQDMGPYDGLRRRTQTVVSDTGMVTYVQQRQAPKGIPITVMVNDGKSPPQVNGESGVGTAATIQDPLQQVHFNRMKPKYQTGGRS